MTSRYVSGLCITSATCLAPVICRASRVPCQMTCAVVSPQVRKEHACFLRRSCLTFRSGRNKQLRFISSEYAKFSVTVMIVFIITNLMHKFFISIHLLYSCTCFEHYYAHLQEDNCISTAYGIVTLFR